MNKVDYLLTVLAEECAETIQRVTKAQRFGLTEIQKGQGLNNQERLTIELRDITACIEMLREAGVWMPVYDSSELTAKKKRIEEYMELSRKQGKLDD